MSRLDASSVVEAVVPVAVFTLAAFAGSVIETDAAPSVSCLLFGQAFRTVTGNGTLLEMLPVFVMLPK
ncbi:MAG: hypothetical protein FWD80_03385, partial [Propionibacteriaceae bacterium]|nr:hypothetical protein [Propionibacteriaceae bacterium]